MAEGTYGSPYYQQIVSPTTSSTKFATSVTRKKTRKWVEAKKINYDGSGWGDDDDEDDDEYEDEPAPAAAGPAHKAPLALPSQQSSLPSTILSRNSSPSPSLHLQTQPPASSSPSLPSQTLPSQSLPSQQPWRQGSPAPSFTSDSASGIVSPRSGALPTWRDGRAESPLGPRGQSPANSAGPNGPRAFVRPSEIYKRSIGQDEPPVSKAVELPAAPAPAPAPKAASPSAPVELPAAAVEPTSAPTITPTPQPTVQPKSPAIVETVIEAPAIATEAASEAKADGTATDANGERRFSSSPKLPDLARFSMFSPDLLFSGSNFLASDTPPVPSVPGAASQSINKEASKEAAQPKLASVAEDVDRTSGTASPFSTSSIKSGSAIRDSAATAATASSLADGPENNSVGGGKSTLARAAEPEADQATEEVKVERKEPVATASPDYSAGQIAPLKPNRASQMFLPSVSLPMAPMGPRGLERTSTVDTVSASVTSSPVKESDMLSDEIIRTLSPVKSAHSAQSAHSDINQIVNEPDTTAATTASEANTKSEEERSMAEPTRTMTRESTYLSDVYDDYWSPEDGSGQDAYTPPPVPPLSTASIPATATIPTEPVAVPAMTESPEMTTASPYNLPSQTQQVPPLVNSPSPAASFGIAPAPAAAPAPSPAPAPAVAAVASAVPASVSSAPGTRSSSSATARNLRRRFSWEAEPESSPSPVMAPSEPAISPAAQESQSPALDPKASISAVSVVSATQESLASPSPLSEVPASTTERPATQTLAQTQGPVRSMLDVGDEKPEKPKMRSMLDFDDVPTLTPAATQAAPATVATPIASATPTSAFPVSAVEDVTSPTVAGVNRESVADSTRSAQSAQSLQSPLPVAPSSAQSNDAPSGLGGVNPAMYGSGNEGTAQFLTLRQCMAFGTHSERMAKLTETRREYSLAESGLSGWLTNITVMPEYSRASYAPLWDGPLTVPPPTSRPAAAAAVAAIAHVPHVNISSSQISNKSKEIFGVAAGKAGKGLLALRKKGFHKKSSN